MNKRTAEHNEMRDFTAKAKDALDAIYAELFDSFKRLDDKERYTRNDMVAVEVTVAGSVISIQEKFAHKKGENQPLYLELLHTDYRGKAVAGVGMKSKAQIIVYAIWDDDTDSLDSRIFLKVKYLQKVASAEYTAFQLRTAKTPARSYSISTIKGSALKTGQSYNVTSYEFFIKSLPDEAFVKLQGNRL